MSKQEHKKDFPHLEIEDIKQATLLLFKISQALHDDHKHKEANTKGLEEIINAANDNVINLLTTLSIMVARAHNSMCRSVMEAVLETDCIGPKAREFIESTLDGGDDE